MQNVKNIILGDVKPLYNLKSIYWPNGERIWKELSEEGDIIIDIRSYIRWVAI